VIVHELLHLLGLYHEHTRHDAPRYIRVHYENIDPARFSNFRPEPNTAPTSSYGIPYDYRSVMHYGQSYFASHDGETTIETRLPYYQDIIGRAESASPSDHLKVCAMYRCSKCMGRWFQPSATDMMRRHLLEYERRERKRDRIRRRKKGRRVLLGDVERMQPRVFRVVLSKIKQ
jgi:Astacin (Peptidase family M12A)